MTHPCFTCRNNTVRQALVLDPPTEATEGSGCGKQQTHLNFLDGFVWISRNDSVAALTTPFSNGTGPPGDSPLTSWNDTALFDGTHYYNSTGYAMWGELVGRLAVQCVPLLVLLFILESIDPETSWSEQVSALGVS